MATDADLFDDTEFPPRAVLLGTEVFPFGNPGDQTPGKVTTADLKNYVEQPILELLTSIYTAPSPSTFLLSRLLSTSPKSAIYPLRDASALSANSDGTGSVSSGGQFRRARDVSKPGINFLLAPNDPSRPTYSPTLGGVFDGSDDILMHAFPGGAGSADMDIIFVLRTANAPRSILSIGSAFTLFPSNGDSSPLANDVWVNGIKVSTRGQLYTAIGVNQNCIIEIRNANCLSAPTISFMHRIGGTWAGAGSISYIDIRDNTTIADPLTARALSYAAAQESFT